MALLLVLFGTVGCNEERQEPILLPELSYTLDQAFGHTFNDFRPEQYFSDLESIYNYFDKQELGDAIFSDKVEDLINSRFSDISDLESTPFFLAQKDFEYRILNTSKIYSNFINEPRENIITSFNKSLSLLPKSSNFIPFSILGSCEEKLKERYKSCEDSALLHSLGCAVGIAGGIWGLVATLVCVEIVLDSRDSCYQLAFDNYKLCKELEVLKNGGN